MFTNLIDTYKADTIEELAGLLGVPADELQKTIDRYNELCDKGTDVDFGKKSAYMHKIVTAPFWGIRKHIRVSSIDSGVNTNANGQALDADGNVIDGLYCVGNVGGVFYGGADYPFHQTGLSLGRATPLVCWLQSMHGPAVIKKKLILGLLQNSIPLSQSRSI